MEDLRPNAKRAKNAITLIWLALALEIISLISGYFQYGLLETAANGGEISIEHATANDVREQIIGIVYLIVFVISAVTFIKWFRRAYFNLHLRVDHLSHTEGWAAGSWFVPIVGFYRPYQIMKELYQETEELLRNNGWVDKNSTIGYLGFWWTLWIISNIIGQLLFRYALKAESIDELTNSTILGMVENIVGIPLALITVKVIKDYAKMDTVLREIESEQETTHIISAIEANEVSPSLSFQDDANR